MGHAEFHQKPDNADLYDLVINTAVLDLDHIVDLVYRALEHKARLPKFDDLMRESGERIGEYHL